METLYQKLEKLGVKFEAVVEELQGKETVIYIVSDEDFEKHVDLNKDFDNTDECIMAKTQADELKLSKSKVASVLKRGYGAEPTREEFEELLRSKGMNPEAILGE